MLIYIVEDQFIRISVWMCLDLNNFIKYFLVPLPLTLVV